MSYNDVILEGTIISDPVFYQYLDSEKIEIKLLTLEGSYTNKEGLTKRMKAFHKVLIYNKYYVEKAKKSLISKNSKITVRAKMASLVDSDGCYSYCACVIGNHHNLQITSNYFRKKGEKPNLLIKDIEKIEEYSSFRMLTAKYARNVWFGQGVMSSHITARMIKENADSDAQYKTLDFMLRIDQSYIDKAGKEKISSQMIKIVITSKKIMEEVIKKKLMRGDIMSVQGMLITKELSKETGYNRTQYIQVSSFVEHNIHVIHKSKLGLDYETYTLETGINEVFLHE
jgi:single-stranded DNA-binding protein